MERERTVVGLFILLTALPALAIGPVGRVSGPPVAQASSPLSFTVTWGGTTLDLPVAAGEGPVFGEHVVPGSAQTRVGWRHDVSAQLPEAGFSLEGTFSAVSTDGTSEFVGAEIVVTNNSPNSEVFSLLQSVPVAAPIVNPLGFMIESRYMPDRRDLNRAFPGSKRGSTASRLAHLFISEVVSQCSVGIDLHTATNHRTNIPQIRADVDDKNTLRLAKAFGAPFTIHARERRGSLRQAATELGATVLVYEAGEAHRFNDRAICAACSALDTQSAGTPETTGSSPVATSHPSPILSIQRPLVQYPIL